VIERASTLLRNDQQKLSHFRERISSFKNGSISASGLVDAFFALFDTSPAELGKLVKELAEIFEITAKRDALLKAWNDWRAINEDYPSLPGANGVPAGANASSLGSGGARVLRLKSSTARSSRSAQSRNSPWGATGSGVSNAASSSTSSGPTPASSRNARGPAPARTVAPMWVSSTNAPRPSPGPSRSASQQALNQGSPASGAEAFPALPAAPKPRSTYFSPGYSGLAVRRDGSGSNTPVNAWGGGSNGATSDVGDGGEEDEPTTGGGKKKKKQNKKQTLFHFG
jgi:E3 ubiquitin-protein ligase ZNF598